MDYEENLKILKGDLDKAKNFKIRAEAKLDQLNIQKNELISNIRKEGIEPENLENEIQRLKNEIERLFKEATELLPRE